MRRITSVSCCLAAVAILLVGFWPAFAECEPVTEVNNRLGGAAFRGVPTCGPVGQVLHMSVTQWDSLARPCGTTQTCYCGENCVELPKSYFVRWAICDVSDLGNPIYTFVSVPGCFDLYWVPPYNGTFWVVAEVTDGLDQTDNLHDAVFAHVKEGNTPMIQTAASFVPEICPPRYEPQKPHDGDPVNLVNGQEDYVSKPDITAYNPHGPNAIYQRSYYGHLAYAPSTSQGLWPGWVDNYSHWLLSIDRQGQTGPDLYLCYANGSCEQIGTAGVLSSPSGAPYVVSGAIGSNITISWKNLSEWTFDPDGNVYRLNHITDPTGHGIDIVRSTSLDPDERGRIERISDSSSPSQALLSFQYGKNADGSDSAFPHALSSITDTASARTVYYTTAAGPGGKGAVLASVSTINGTEGMPRGQYTYAAREGLPLLSGIESIHPNGTSGVEQQITYSDAADSNGRYRITSTVDSNGFRRLYTYNAPASGCLSETGTQVEIQKPLGTTPQTWSTVRRYVQLIDPATGLSAGAYEAGRQTQIEYGSEAFNKYLPVAVKDWFGHITNYTWDVYGNLVKVVRNSSSPSGTAVSLAYTYAPAGYPNLRSITVQQGDANSSGEQQTATVYHFDPTQAFANNPDAANQYSHTPDYGFLTSIDCPVPGTKAQAAQVGAYQFTYDYTYNATAQSFDSLGNLKTITKPAPAASGAVTATLDYGATPKKGEPVSLALPVTSSTTRVTHFAWAADGTLSTVTDAANNQTDFIYDTARALTQIWYPATGETGTGRAMTVLGRNYPGGAATLTSAYTEAGSILAQVANAFGPAGELASVSGDTEPWYASYDASYRLAALRDGNSGPSGPVTTWQYTDTDSTQAATATLPENASHGSGYDQLTADEENPSPCTPTAPYDRIVTLTGGNGAQKQCHYSGPNGELVDVVYPDTTNNVHITHDIYGRITSIRHGVSDSSYREVTSYTYDDRGNVLTVTTQYAGLAAKTITYTYYPDGHRKTMVLPGVGTFTYTYNRCGQLTGLSTPFNTSAAWTYKNNGWLWTQVMGPVSTTYGYNQRGFLKSIHNQNTSGSTPMTWSDFALTRDALGNALSVSASNFGLVMPGPPGMGMASAMTATLASSDFNGSTAFTYAPSQNEPNQAYGPLRTEHTTRFGGLVPDNVFAYDQAYNPLTFAGTAYPADANGNVYNADNQRTSADYAYDGAGNPTTYRGTAMAYTADGALASVNGGTVSFTYRADGLRASKIQGTSEATRRYYLYDGILPVCELDSAGNVVAVNTFGANGLLSRRVGAPANGTDTFYAFDPMGNVANAVANQITGAPSGYDSFGKRHGAATTDPFGYQAQWGAYTDSETALVLMGYRYYDPGTGRFLTRDPIGYSGGINLYAYCRNNPVNYADPWGLKRVGISIGGAGGLLIGGHIGGTFWFDTSDLSYDGFTGSAGLDVGIMAGGTFGAGLAYDPHGCGLLKTDYTCATETHWNGQLTAFGGWGGGGSLAVDGPLAQTDPTDVTRLDASRFFPNGTYYPSAKLGPTLGGGIQYGVDLIGSSIAP